MSRCTSLPGRPSSACALVVATLLSWPVLAQDLRPKSQALDPVVVTAARAPQSMDELTSDVTVIGPEDIARSGADSLAQLLQRQPGVEITMNGGRANVSGAFIRGANANQTLVLVDGLRISSSTTGATTLEAIPLEQIERIEILRGPASALYGADAIGGVIQIFTRQGARGFSANANAGGGTDGTVVGGAGLSGATGPFRYALQAGGRRSDGFNAIVDPSNFSYNPDRDGYDGWSVTANGAWTWAKEQEIAVQFLRTHLDAQYDGGPGFDDRQVTNLSGWNVASRNRLSDRWTWSISAGETKDDSEARTGFGNFPFDTTQRLYLWQNDVALGPVQLTFGYERREERVSADPPLDADARDTNGYFAILRAKEGPHALQANVRVDDSNQFGARTTGTLAYGYSFAPGWRVTVGGGTAFRPPSFNDLYYPGFSNPDLAPERSRSAELGLHGAGVANEVRYEARVVGWVNRVTNLIVFTCDADFNCAPQNADRARLAGVTLAGEARWRDTFVRASLDLQDPENRTTGAQLPRRAKSHGAVAIAQAWGRARVGAEVVASAHRYDDAANAIRLAGYGILNLTAEWSATPRVTLFLRADNVFDRDYQLAAGYSTGGAQVFGGLRWAM
jgi:vitamin B12 transporter